MSTYIEYNNVNLFDGIGPTPFISRSVEPIRYGKKFGAKDVFTLEGQITGSCSTGYSDIITKTTTLFNRLSQDFKRFKIISVGQTVIDKQYAKVVSFNCDEDITFAIKPYSITIETYDDKYFNLNDFGIVDPSNEISYSEGENGEISITHTISAKGFKTNKDPLQNAIDYVNSNSELGNQVASTQRILKNGSITAPVLVSISEEVNRLESLYSLTKKYICDARKPNNGIIFNSSIDFSYDEESGVYSADFSGSVSGGSADSNLGKTSFQEIRESIKKINFYSITNTAFKKAYDIDLNPNILNLKVEEDEDNRSISFSCSFNSDKGAGTAFIESESTISYNDISEIHEISFTGTIKGRKSQKARWSEVKNFFNAFNVRAACEKLLSEEVSGAKLEQYPTSYSVGFDERNCQISINASFKQINPANSWYNQFRNLTFDIEVSASKAIILPVQTLNNGAKVVDIEAKTRPQCSISGSLSIANPCSESDAYTAVKSFALSALAKFLNIKESFLEQIEITKDLSSGSQTYNFSISVSTNAGQFYIE